MLSKYNEKTHLLIVCLVGYRNITAGWKLVMEAPVRFDEGSCFQFVCFSLLVTLKLSSFIKTCLLPVTGASCELLTLLCHMF